MNWYDSARLSATLVTAGHQSMPTEEQAEYVFVNSCTVTNRADRQSRQQAHKVTRNNQKLVVFGCGPAVQKTAWQQRFDKAHIFPHIDDLLAHFGIEKNALEFPEIGRTRIPIAIQTGCDNHCTFCITRLARGKTEDFSKEGILRQIQRARECGVQEVVLTGIQLASYGCGDSEKHPERSKLPHLLQFILDQSDIPRIRLSSLGPQFLHDDFFEILKNPRICNHLHLSVQSGSKNVLTKMNRGHDAKTVFHVAERAQQVADKIALTADFITGFPGEAEQDFQDTLEMVERIGFAQLHVFPFSAREGTGAANMPGQIPVTIRKQRAQILRQKAAELEERFIKACSGKTLQFLAEDKQEALSSNYLRIATSQTKPGELFSAELNSARVVRQNSFSPPKQSLPRTNRTSHDAHNTSGVLS